MKIKSINSAFCLVVLCLASVSNAAIYINSNLGGSPINPPYLYPGDILDLTVDSPYRYSLITMTDDSVINIHYQDILQLNCYGPAFIPGIDAQDNAVINFIYPENYNFFIPDTFQTYTGLQINVASYPEIASGFSIYRDYEYVPGQMYLLDPVAGNFSLQNNAVLNFVPEPATIILLGTAVPLMLRKRQRM